MMDNHPRHTRPPYRPGASSKFHEVPYLTSEARETAARLPNRERQRLVQYLLHRYPTFDTGWNMLKDCHLPVEGGSPGAGVFGGLYGDTRTGKSAICKAYVAEHPSFVAEDGEVYPIVYIEAKASMTPSTLTDQFFLKTGARAQATRIAQSTRDMNAIDRLVRHRTEMVIIDDAQYLLFDRRRDEVPKFNSFIRSLIEARSFAVLLVGEPRVRDWVLGLPELSGRDYFEEEIEHFDRSPEGQEDFQLLMGGIDDLLPFAEPSELGEFEVAAEMYEYADGYLGRAMNLIRRASWTSINEGHRRIKMETLAEWSRRMQWKTKNVRPYFEFGGGR
jgi:hypothetical protein